MKKLMLKDKYFMNMFGEYERDEPKKGAVVGEKVLISKSLCTLLGSAADSDRESIMKGMSLSARCLENANLEIDEPDLEYIEKAVIEADRWPRYLKAQVLSLLKEAKEISKKK